MFQEEEEHELIPEMNRDLMRHLSSNLRELNVIMKLSLTDYEEIERPRASARSPCKVPSMALSTRDLLKSAWLDLPSEVSRMYKLRNLLIWLDLCEPYSWSMVNERAILSTLTPLCNSTAQILINLPKLHPKYESPERHFTYDSEPFCIPIHRRCRAQIRTRTESDGSIVETVRLDFPQCSQMACFILDGGVTESAYSRQEELEQWERKQWEGGDDPVQYFEDYLAMMRGILYRPSTGSDAA